MHINLADFFTIQSCFIGNRTDNIAWFCTVVFTYFNTETLHTALHC
ncbi:hypothetical protein BMETH_1189_0 [methanotrophic bacterial endosymbiont of Bathymodiolus sp.]|nr:hypothetical protein BMETH_1189_0 [methanotrophic bacterial endosymbiont of Bathymodiolus sp.]